MNKQLVALMYLKRGQPLTDNIARDLWGYNRVAVAICRWRERGWPITTELASSTDRNGNAVRYGVYRLDPDKRKWPE